MKQELNREWLMRLYSRFDELARESTEIAFFVGSWTIAAPCEWRRYDKLTQYVNALDKAVDDCEKIFGEVLTDEERGLNQEGGDGDALQS